VIYLHGQLYNQEYQYGIQFESYVASGLAEFYNQFEPEKNGVWICEHSNKIVGFLSLMNRHESAQLRYFLIAPGYRNIGLGKKLMELYMNFLRQADFKSAYLWTTHELPAAAALYTRHGFKLVEEKPSDAFGKLVKEQKYELILND
jgi:peptidyl-dipeptidase Dcp